MAYYAQVISRPDAASISAFGDLVTAENTPLIQIDWVHGANTQVGTLAASGTGATADTTSGMLRLQSGTANNGTASYTSARAAKYRQGQGITARFTTVFANTNANNKMLVGMGSSTDGYFVGYNGTSFGILHRNNSSDTWIPTASWVGDALSFTPDYTKGNVWMIRYPFLGFGAIRFFLLSPAGVWTLVHTIEYPNSSATPQLRNPNLPFFAQSINGAAGTTNCICYCASVGVFLNGNRSFLGPTWASSNRKTSITTETNLLTIRNATTYNGILNRSLIRIKSISVAWDNVSNTALLNVIKGTTLGGSPAYAAINGTTADAGVTITSGNSVASVDKAGTTITGGNVLFNISLARYSSTTMDMTSLDLFLEPGSILTFSITGDQSGDARVSVNWVEDI